MTPDDTANTYLQVGAVVFALGLGARAAGRAGLSPIPLYLLAGLVVGVRDFNAALFFLFFGLQVRTSELPSVAVPLLALVGVSSVTKALVGWRAAELLDAGPEGCARAATALIARGEMSIVLATLGAGATAELEPLAAGYVLVLAIVGPVLMRFPGPVDAIARRLTNRAELARAN